MTTPLSQDLRERIARSVDAGGSARGAARRFEVNPSAAIKLMRRVRETGSTAPAKIGGHRRAILEGYEDYLRNLARAHKGITLKEIKADLAARGVAVSKSAICAMLHKLGLSHKKKVDKSRRAGSSGCRRAPPALESLAAFHGRDRFCLPRRDGCLDQHGPPPWLGSQRRAPRRCGAKRPLAHNHLRRPPAIDRRHAPLVLDGPMTGELFLAYVAQLLALALRPSDVVVMDYRPAHKVAAVAAALDAVGADVLYLPPYSPVCSGSQKTDPLIGVIGVQNYCRPINSPDLNPIEQMFAKLKARLRFIPKVQPGLVREQSHRSRILPERLRHAPFASIRNPVLDAACD